MGVLTQADGFALERLAELYADIVDLGQAIADGGRTYESKTEAGGTIVRPRPEVAMLSDADRRFRAYLIEFGLTPAARSKVKSDGGETEAANPAAAYF
jgi:P27 family predicted phage terminase small subunit